MILLPAWLIATTAFAQVVNENSCSKSQSSNNTQEYNFGELQDFAFEITQLERNAVDPRYARQTEIQARGGVIIPNGPVVIDKSYGLDRINQENLPLDNIYAIIGNQGAGVTVYILDTGIDTTHPQFRVGRAIAGPSFVTGKAVDLKIPNTDHHGHGTHIAGTIAGETIGVAPKAKMIGLQVVDKEGYGPTTALIAALKYATENRIPGKTVISMSISQNWGSCGEGPGIHQNPCDHPELRQAVREAVNAGIPVVVPAGNYRVNACRYSPANEPLAFTVGAIDDYDYLDQQTSYGTCIDMFAPGVGIFSTGINNGISYRTGSSMAVPFVSGVFAALLSTEPYARMTVEQLYKQVIDWSAKDKIQNNPFLPKTYNRILYIPYPVDRNAPKQVARRSRLPFNPFRLFNKH